MTDTSTFKSVIGAACVGIVIGALAFSLTVSGQTQEPVMVAQGNSPSDIQLGEARNGVITKVRDMTVWINGTSYALAYDMMVQHPDGTPVLYQDIAGDNLELNVHFWLGLGKDSNKIVKMIVYFPR